jgi:hypothetical protein
MRTSKTLGALVAAVVLLAVAGRAQDSGAPDPAPSANGAPAPIVPAKGQETAIGQPGVVQDKRIFGVLPNYRTAEGSVPYKPITAKQKFMIATKDTMSPPSYLLGGVFAGLSQLNNSNPSFGQGAIGYAKRYGTNTADQVIGNYMTEAIMPTILHEDPRYFRKSTGSIKSRIGYAVARVVVTKTDSGGTRFNYSEFLGNGTVAAIGNLYYPDDKGFSSTMQRMASQIGTDAISNVLKEIWPDVKRKWLHKEPGE